MSWIDYPDSPCPKFKEYLRGDCCCEICGWTKQEHEERDADYAADARDEFEQRMKGVKTGLDSTNNPDNW